MWLKLKSKQVITNQVWQWTHHLLCHFVCIVFLDVVVKLNCFVLLVLMFPSLGVDDSQPQLYHVMIQVLGLVLIGQFNLDAGVLQEEVMLQQHLHRVSDKVTADIQLSLSHTHVHTHAHAHAHTHTHTHTVLLYHQSHTYKLFHNIKFYLM